MTSKIKALILLFVCGDEYGSQRYDDLKNISLKMWDWGKFLPDESINISPNLFDLCIERDQLSVSKDKEDQRKAKKCRINIKNTITDICSKNFQSAVSYLQKDNDITDDDRLASYVWLQYFQKNLNNCLDARNEVTTDKLGSAYLCRRIYKEWTSYVAMKFIDLGKAVYHFATPVNLYDLGNDNIIGKIRNEFLGGITSFDYERISAEEHLKRNLAISATYAAAVFSNCVVSPETRKKLTEELRKKPKHEKDDMSDVLMYTKEQLEADKVLRTDAKRRILQFFGGLSKWENAEDSIISICEPMDIALPLQRAIKVIRNHSYHYGPRPGGMNDEDTEVLRAFLTEEFNNLNSIYVSKYYSNNVPQFYAKESIITLFNYLYSRPVYRPAQIPAFANVLPRKEASDLIFHQLCPGKKNMDDKTMQKFRSSMYFVLKEIYYNGFLQENDIKERFMNAMKAYEPENKDRQNAFDDFAERIQTIKNEDFGAICQQIMTDVNMQNQGIKAIRTKEQIKKAELAGKKDIYQHYKMLLLKFIRDAFIDYVRRGKNDIYGFLKKPVSYKNAGFADKPSLEEFLEGDWQASNFDEINNFGKDNSLVLAWYITAHFIPPKQLNMLRGDIKEYQQYLVNINRRAKFSGNAEREISTETTELYNKILLTLDFVSLFNGRISNEITDYFSSKTEYWEYLNKFLSFDLNKYTDEDIFYDGQREILMRGVVISVMYGMEAILPNIDYKVTETDYLQYTKLKAKVAGMLAKGQCKDMVEQKEINRYQHLKKRLSLHDLLDLSQMIMDHMSQLVSFAYMRERDLMYFQLGMNYVRLYYSDIVPENSYWRTFKTNEAEIKDGALLYDIISMYTPDMDMYGFKKKDSDIIVNLKKAGSAGAGVGKFLRSYPDAEDVYLCGIDFFIKENMFDDMTDFRNSIDHMKYLSGNGMSILDCYSRIFNGFFQYNTSLKKSVGYILKNIMMRYFLAADLYFKNKSDGKDKNAGCREIIIKKITSDVFTYKLPEHADNGKNNNRPQGRTNSTIKKNNSANLSGTEDYAKSNEFIKCVANLMSLRRG